MIISRQKSLSDILVALEGSNSVFIIGCAKCATACKSGGDEQVWQMQDQLTSAGKGVTGSVVIDEACHLLRTQRDLREKRDGVENADALLVLACGAGIQSVAAAGIKKTIAGTDTLFVGNTRRFGHFDQKCSLCGDCSLTACAGICPVTLCPKGMMNGPCGGMTDGRCETDAELECAWAAIYEKLKKSGEVARLQSYVQPRDHSVVRKPGSLKIER